MLENYLVSPMQEPLTDCYGAGDFVIDDRIYDGVTYPRAGTLMREPAIRRDVRFVIVDVYPLITYSADRLIDAAHQVTFELIFTNHPGINEKVRQPGAISPELDNMYRTSYLNYDSLGMRTGPGRSDDVPYLIITTDAHIAAITPLADWWNRAGLRSEIMLTSDIGSTPALIKAAIQDYYDNHGLEYVLLVGSLNAIPLGNPGGMRIGDYNYQLLDGDDDYADIALGRILHDDNDVISHVVARTLNFIQNPPDDGWLNKSSLLADGELYPGKYTECKEFIRTFDYAIENYEYDTFYPPEGATGAELKAAMEEGRVIVNYRGHGMHQEWSWYDINWKTNADIYALENGPYTPIVWNIACYNGNVNYSGGECFSEAWQNAGSSGEGGAVANIGATEPSYTIANHAFDKMLYQAPLNEGITRLGHVIDRSKQYMIEDEGDFGVDNSEMYLLFGCPAIDIHARTLFAGDISHLPTVSMGGSYFDVTVMESGVPIENALVCIMKDDDDLYEVGYTDATGSVTLESLVVSVGYVQLTVTAHNMQPYLADIEVMAAGCGAVLMDKNVYGCDHEIILNLWDSDLNQEPGSIETAFVEISSDTDPAPQMIELTETGPDTGRFMGSVMTSGTHSGGGYLQVSDGDTITLYYFDEDCDGAPQDVYDYADVDCMPPVISNVTISEISTDSFTVSWTTDEIAETHLSYGDSTPPTNDVSLTGMRTEHSVTVTDLADCTLYYFEIGATDIVGNHTVDNNQGAYYSALTYELIVMLDENMDTDPGWTYENQWQWGAATGSGGNPPSGHTGTHIVGYNLSGNYQNNLPETYVTTTSFDCSDVGEVYLSFWRWLGVESSTWDHASIIISNNGGSSWQTVWEHAGGTIEESSWSYQEYDITSWAAGYSDVRLRWVMGPTDGSVVYSGWNIDDVLVSCVVECTSVPTPTPAPTYTPTPEPTPTPDCLHSGDVNQDGVISAADAQMAFMIALGSYTPTYEEECAADCNGDGVISAADAQQIFLTTLGAASCVDPL
jgi:hypothetical protein